MTMTAVPSGIEVLFVGREKAAELIDVSTRTIDDALRAGELKAHRVGRRVLIPRDELVRFVTEGRRPSDL